MTRRVLLVVAILLCTICVALWATGGFATSLRGIRLSARSPRASGFGAAVFAVLWVVAAWRTRSIAEDLFALDQWIERWAGVIIASMAALAAAIAVRFATFSASGSDPSGYLSEAVMLASGALSRTEPIAAIADWPDAAQTLAPLGWQAAASTQVPTYAVGLPLLMTVPHALGGAVAASLVVCASAALSVWFAGRTAAVLAGGAAGALAAAALATMPVHLYESMQPMSDVPVTAAWLACWWWIARSAVKGAAAGHHAVVVTAGIAAAIAVLIRPNLAPLAAVPALWFCTRPHGGWRATALWFAIPVAAAGLVIAYLQWRWFGSPLRSGYGSPADLYAVRNIGPNAALYFAWLVDTGGAWLLAAPFAVAVSSKARALLGWMLAFAALVCVAYFVYFTFEAWPYLRFLLPALAMASIAAAVAAADGIRLTMGAGGRAGVVVLLILALAAVQTARARELGVFRLAARQSRAVLAGHYLAAALPADAVLISGEQSGAMRYYTGRSIVRWDLLQPQALPQVEERLVTAGHDVWIVLDDWEVALYRDKFRSTPHAALDWPPAVDAGSDGRTQAWRLVDRARFLAGELLPLDRLR